jgi:hypothetical protein
MGSGGKLYRDRIFFLRGYIKTNNLNNMPYTININYKIG